jgi:hypothetical protein
MKGVVARQPSLKYLHEQLHRDTTSLNMQPKTTSHGSLARGLPGRSAGPTHAVEVPADKKTGAGTRNVGACLTLNSSLAVPQHVLMLGQINLT